MWRLIGNVEGVKFTTEGATEAINFVSIAISIFDAPLLKETKSETKIMV